MKPFIQKEKTQKGFIYVTQPCTTADKTFSLEHAKDCYLSRLHVTAHCHQVLDMQKVSLQK